MDGIILNRLLCRNKNVSFSVGNTRNIAPPDPLACPPSTPESVLRSSDTFRRCNHPGKVGDIEQYTALWTCVKGSKSAHCSKVQFCMIDVWRGGWHAD